MKKIILAFLAAGLCLGGCTKGNKYQISGTWEEGDGKTVYLQKEIGKDDYSMIDSAVVINGVFEMAGHVPEIDKYTIFIENLKENVILDEVPITIQVTTELHENTKGEMRSSTKVALTGSPEQEILREAGRLATTKGFLGFGSMFMMVQVKDDPHALDSVYRMTEQLKAEMDDRIHSYFDSINDSYAITYSISDFIGREYPFEDVVRYTDNLTPRIKNSYPGKMLLEKVDALRDINIGGTAPEIDLPDPDGNNVKLSSLRGKYVLLDFWASWCGPCLAEVPNVKAIYDDYRDKGFEIYGVSLDDGKQRGAWLEKIEQNDMNWVQVSALKGWDCPAAKRYNVTGIPKMFLLDKEGRIIAVDLRGEALREKVASLFD